MVGVLQMCFTPILFYPYAKALWLAIDLIVRGVQPDAITTTADDLAR